MFNRDVRMNIISYIYDKKECSLISKNWYENVYEQSLRECKYDTFDFDIDKKQKHIYESMQKNPSTISHPFFATETNIAYILKKNIDYIVFIKHPSPDIQLLYYYNNNNDKNLSLLKNKSPEIINLMLKDNRQINGEDIPKLSNLQRRNAIREGNISYSDIPKPRFTDMLMESYKYPERCEFMLRILQIAVVSFILYRFVKRKLSFFILLNLLFAIYSYSDIIANCIWMLMRKSLMIFDNIATKRGNKYEKNDNTTSVSRKIDILY